MLRLIQTEPLPLIFLHAYARMIPVSEIRQTADTGQKPKAKFANLLTRSYEPSFWTSWAILMPQQSRDLRVKQIALKRSTPRRAAERTPQYQNQRRSTHSWKDSCRL